MLDKFESYITAHAELSAEEIKLICSMGVEKQLRKKQALLHEGEICNYKIFVCKGLLRTYRTKEDGSEHIIWFSPENSWTTDPENRDFVTPSRYNIDALEDSDIVLWSKRDFERAYQQIPGLKAFTESLISNNLTLSRNRLFSALSATAEEKYDEFIETYPSLLARVPLHMVASYLGLSRKTLTRIRYAQLKG